MTITEFLLARIEEDEKVARECLEPKNLVPYSDDRIPAIKPEEWGDLVDNYLGGPMGTHCARHDPLRVLAECAAKRAIIALHRPIEQLWWPEQVPVEVCKMCDEERWECETILALASVYSLHPDYKWREWK